MPKMTNSTVDAQNRNNLHKSSLHSGAFQKEVDFLLELKFYSEDFK